MRADLLNAQDDGRCHIPIVYWAPPRLHCLFADAIKKLLLGCSRAHVFYLYPTLCKTMVSKDATVVALIGELLEVAGQAMGLCPGPDSS